MQAVVWSVRVCKIIVMPSSVSFAEGIRTRVAIRMDKNSIPCYCGKVRSEMGNKQTCKYEWEEKHSSQPL